MPKIKRAIISVTDKTGIVELGQALHFLKVEILSTGGTAKILRDAKIPVMDVAEYTGSPEILDGRLKTLHPKIEGGILGIRSNQNHQKEMADNDIHDIDLVAVNLYAFEKTISKAGCSLEEAVENIDIGGPTMLRAAAKNHPFVTVVVDPVDYPKIIDELQRNKGEISEETNFKLAVKVFQTTAAYDSAISRYLTSQVEKDQAFPELLTLQFQKVQDLRYGENPHQRAAAYRDIPECDDSILRARQIHGKELSFNNWIDLEAAYNCVREFKNDAACVIIKHTNPCGAALGENLKDAFLRAKETDPVSAFGGIIGFNRRVDVETATAVSDTFFECIIAPDFDKEAFNILAAKKNIRLMTIDNFFGTESHGFDTKRIRGGLLVQDKDNGMVNLKECVVPTKRRPSESEFAELEFAWKICKHVKSNAIVYTKNKQVIGIGAGQMSRVDSAQIAKMKSRQPLTGAVMASDAFFPFRDGLDTAGEMGISAVVQPGGSVRDEEVIQAADEHSIAMIFTGMRHFKH